MTTTALNEGGHDPGCWFRKYRNEWICKPKCPVRLAEARAEFAASRCRCGALIDEHRDVLECAGDPRFPERTVDEVRDEPLVHNHGLDPSCREVLIGECMLELHVDTRTDLRRERARLWALRKVLEAIDPNVVNAALLRARPNLLDFSAAMAAPVVGNDPSMPQGDIRFRLHGRTVGATVQAEG